VREEGGEEREGKKRLESLFLQVNIFGMM